MNAAAIGEYLLALEQTHFIELTTHMDGHWRLEVIARERGFVPKAYTGDLEPILRQAYHELVVAPRLCGST